MSLSPSCVIHAFCCCPSIAFTLLELARNPREQTKLRESLRAMPRTSWANSECLKCVVKEGMRLHPVGRSMRVAGSDTRTSRNKLVPKGALCINHFLLLFRNPDIFAAPASFLPSRWENPSREMLDAFNPFSLGKQNWRVTGSVAHGLLDSLLNNSQSSRPFLPRLVSANHWQGQKCTELSQGFVLSWS